MNQRKFFASQSVLCISNWSKAEQKMRSLRMIWVSTSMVTHQNRVYRALSKVARSTRAIRDGPRPDNSETKGGTSRSAGNQTSAPNKKLSMFSLALGGIAVYATGLGLSLYYFQDDGNKVVHVSETERRQAYDHGAATYETDVCSSEDWMGITPLRKLLISKASGKVLEVAAGTGVNLARNLYPKSCGVTCIDCSQAMVDIARSKLLGKGHGRGDIDAGIDSVTVMDADNLNFPDNHFDTVVDTFGLCSFEDPVATLKEMQRVCKVGGKVLLLEHGRSFLPPVNLLLDWSSHKHAARWGCYWNRDLVSVVEAASGFKLLEKQRKHLGTTYLFVLERVR